MDHHLVSSGSEESSESNVITLLQQSHLDTLTRGVIESDASDEIISFESEASKEDPHDSVKLEYAVSLCYYGNETIIRHHDALSTTNNTATVCGAIPRKLTPRRSSHKPITRNKVNKNYKHKKMTTSSSSSLQIADPEKVSTCSITTRVLSCNKTGKRKSISRASFWVD